jgi:hypothetical protein
MTGRDLRAAGGTWYDRADLYDVLFGGDPAPERDFVLESSERWGRGVPRRILEPFCGSGRLLRAMPASARVAGFDRNPRMLRIAARRARLARLFRADAASFAVAPASFDLAYCLIDSFRHLLREDDACAHLRRMAGALEPGAVYVLGFDVYGDVPYGDTSATEWTSERDGVRVDGCVRGLGDADPATRIETVHVRMRVRRTAGACDGTREEVVEDFFPMRVYRRRDLRALLAREGSFRIAAACDPLHDVTRTIDFDTCAGSVLLVLVRR